MGVTPDEVRAMDPVDAAAVTIHLQREAERAYALRMRDDG